MTKMAQRRTTAPPTRVSSRSSQRTVRADCKGKTEKQSAKKRTALDNRFHRTSLVKVVRLVPRAEAGAARRLPRMTFGELSGELQPP